MIVQDTILGIFTIIIGISCFLILSLMIIRIFQRKSKSLLFLILCIAGFLLSLIYGAVNYLIPVIPYVNEIWIIFTKLVFISLFISAIFLFAFGSTVFFFPKGKVKILISLFYLIGCINITVLILINPKDFNLEFLLIQSILIIIYLLPTNIGIMIKCFKIKDSIDGPN